MAAYSSHRMEFSTDFGLLGRQPQTQESTMHTFIEQTPCIASRRGFMGRGVGTLSAVSIALLAGKDVLAQGMGGDMAQVAARLAADETMHYTLLNSALGRPLPDSALSFGA